MKVKVDSLPEQIRKILPLSLQIQDEIDVDILPIHLKETILSYLRNFTSTSNNQNIIDYTFSKGYYSLNQLSTVKDTVIYYIKQFFSVPKGSYPFDPEFGTVLYEYIQTRNISIIELILNKEINELLYQIKRLFNVNVSVNSIIVDTYDLTERAELYIKMSLKINNVNNEVTLNLKR